MMMKKLVLLLCFLLLTGSVCAASSAELRQELEALQDQAAALREEGEALEAELEGNQADTRSTIDKKFDIDRRIHQTEQEIQNRNLQIQQYQRLIAQKQKDLESAQRELEEQQSAARTRLRAMEEQGRISYWSILFKSRSFADLLDRVQMIQEIAEADRQMMAQLQESAAQVEVQQHLLQAELAAQETAAAELAALEAELERQRAEADRYLIELAEVMDGLTAEYDALAAQEAAVQQEIMAAQAAYDKALSAEQAARLAQNNQSNAAGGGQGTGGTSGFRCPVSGAFITDPYGWRNHPVDGQRKFHTGVDFAVPMNTPIYAMASGVVSACGSNNAYGYYVTLSHGGGYGSFYGHMTNYIVSSGDEVSQGQVIGYVGSTGISTGPHLHFEIYVNGGTVNPMEYVSLS